MRGGKGAELLPHVWSLSLRPHDCLSSSWLSLYGESMSLNLKERDQYLPLLPYPHYNVLCASPLCALQDILPYLYTTSGALLN
jgi:hypothetical protein